MLNRRPSGYTQFIKEQHTYYEQDIFATIAQFDFNLYKDTFDVYFFIKHCLLLPFAYFCCNVSHFFCTVVLFQTVSFISKTHAVLVEGNNAKTRKHA